MDDSKKLKKYDAIKSDSSLQEMAAALGIKEKDLERFTAQDLRDVQESLTTAQKSQASQMFPKATTEQQNETNEKIPNQIDVGTIDITKQALHDASPKPDITQQQSGRNVQIDDSLINSATEMLKDGLSTGKRQAKDDFNIQPKRQSLKI